ncbi:trigger factor [Sinimarinibacterium sp. NLF-5-8]|uniref:trigger factor n=1 Tax=Sinimarinibacterium sp. NLF-5-8 TaxID=2698684 RepID=UPI00137B9F75|nr:trigger factor [Sinimarinibacterium sp. NLF-5-8]QHS09714.1 trigger factor [Sinimarinibacterium sp. NLF-5-8]
MEVNVEAPGGLRRQMRVRVPADRVTRAVEDRLKRYASRAKLPGFRPGKAPRKVIEQQFGDSARFDAVSDLIQQTYPEAISQAGVNPAGQPKIDVTAEKLGDVLEYVADFEVYPEIALQALDTLTIEKPVVEVSEADVDRLIENLRKARRTFSDAERAAASGDRVTIDFLGRLEGEAFPGGEGKDVTFEIGASQFLPDLENGVVGHSAGDSFTVDVAFPEDYRAENLKGKTAQFEVTLKKVEAASLPQIDAEFLKAHNADEAAGEAGLREKCKAALEKERDKGIQARLKEQALNQLLDANPHEVPQALVTQEIARLRQEAAARMGLREQDQERMQGMFPDEMFTENAKRRVSLGLLINEVISSKQIKPDAERVEQALGNIAADYEEPEQVRAYYRSRPDMMQGLAAMVVEDQVVELLVAAAKVTEKSLTLEELLNTQRAAAQA